MQPTAALRQSVQDAILGTTGTEFNHPLSAGEKYSSASWPVILTIMFFAM